MGNQEYRIHVRVRRRAEAPFESIELQSEDYDNDEDYCLAIASKVMDALREDREFLEASEG